MPSARTTAMSLLGSVPTTVNDAVRPSKNVTLVCVGDCDPALPGSPGIPGRRRAAAPGLPVAAATTWLLVRIRPSEVRMMPDPSSEARPRSVSSLTTLGTTLAATCSTEPAGNAAAGTVGAAPAMLEPRLGLSGWASTATPPPTPADTTATPARRRSTTLRANAFGAGTARRHGRGRGAVRVIRRAELLLAGLLSGVAPVVGSVAVVRIRPVRPRVSGRRGLIATRPTARLRWRVPRVVRHSLLSSSFCEGSDKFSNALHEVSQCPRWAENPLRDDSVHGRDSAWAVSRRSHILGSGRAFFHAAGGACRRNRR